VPHEEAPVTNSELSTFCRQFSSLVHAQINILDIFEALREQSSNSFLREVIDNVRTDIENGRTLATAFSRYPQVFSPFFISMIRQGELEGELDRVLSDLATHFETRLEDTPDATRRRGEGLFDWEAAAHAFQWLFIWMLAITGVCFLAAALVWHATTEGALPGNPGPNAIGLVGIIMLLGVVAMALGRKRR
jgi:hypothetical protein